MTENSSECKGHQEAGGISLEASKIGTGAESAVSEAEGSNERSWVYQLIDCAFWLFDETCRWLEIGAIAVKQRKLEIEKNSLLKKYGADFASASFSEQDKQQLELLEADIKQLSARDELLRSQCWGITPELLFTFLFLAYVYCIIIMSPVKNLLPSGGFSFAALDSAVKSVRELPFSGHSVITKAIWHDNKLFVGGDGGLSVVNTASGSVYLNNGLPEGFFVRDLCSFNGELYIGGYGGVYKLANTAVLPVYTGKSLPVKLVNSLAVTDDNKILIGTIGMGVMLGKTNSAVMLLDTKGTVQGFARQKKDLWVLYENAVYSGRGSSFKWQNLQILAGKHLRCMATTPKSVFIGTDQGVAAGYKNSKSWVWTPLSVRKPTLINDLAIAGNSLFIAANEGTFRFSRGRLEKLSSAQASALCVCGTFLASVNTNAVTLFYFSDNSHNENDNYALVPQNTKTITTEESQKISVLPISRLKYGRLPDFKQFLQNENASELAKTKASDEAIEVDKRPFVPIPIELQSPIFTSVVQNGQNFVLATKNRGIWLYNGKSWVNADSMPNLGLEHLAQSKNSFYAYGANGGIYRLENGTGAKIAVPDDLKDLASIYAEDSDELFLLYKNGAVKGFKGGVFYNMFVVPHEFSGEFCRIYKLNKRFVIVVDQGVMLPEKESQWKLVYFDGALENARVVSTALGDNNSLFIALEDGKIFEYANEKLELLGVVDDGPVSINYSGCLWVACKNYLFFMENKNFIKTPFRSTDKIIGVFVAPESEAFLVFTDKGVNQISGREQP